MSTSSVMRIGLRIACAALLFVGAPLGGTLLARHGEPRERLAANVARAAGAGEAASPREDELVGVLLPSQMANLTPRADGKVVEIVHRVGQPVLKGDVIVGFDLRERQHDLAYADAQLKAARADAAAAGADLAFARKRAARRNTTVEVGGEQIALVSGEEVAQARSEADQARARAAAASAHIAEQEARVEQLRLAVQDSEIRAPFDGIVSSINFEPGMTAHPGEVVARVVGGPGLRVRIAVPEEQAFRLTARHANLSVEGRSLTADIDQVPPEPEPASRAFLVEGSVRAMEAPAQADLQALAGRKVLASLVP